MPQFKNFKSRRLGRLRTGFLFLSGLALCQCSLRPTGRDLAEGLIEPIKKNADTLGSALGGSLGRSARDSLLAMLTQERLDAILHSVGVEANAQAVLLRDSLLGTQTRTYLRRIEEDLVKQLAAARNEALGEKTRGELRLLLALAGDSASSMVGRMRDTLLNARSREALDSLLGGAIAAAATGLERDVFPKLRREQGFLKRNAQALIWTAVAGLAVLLLLAGWLYFRSRKARQTLEVLTLQIDGLENDAVKQQLKRRIALKAAEAKVEPELRKVLKAQGLLGRDKA